MYVNNKFFARTWICGVATSLAVCFFPPTVARATVAITVDAGYLRPYTDTVTPANSDTTPFNTTTGGGALLMLVETGSTLPTTLLAGSYTNPGEIIIAAFGANALGDGKTSGVNPVSTDTRGIETFNGLTNVNFPLLVGNGYVELRWFPSITLSQYNSGTVFPVAGSHFGAYNPQLYPLVNATNLAPDGGSPWTVPTVDGSNDTAYNFFTTDDTGRGADGPGTQTTSEGYANFLVVVPEPSTYGLIGSALVGLMGLRVWKRRPSGRASAL